MTLRRRQLAGIGLIAAAVLAIDQITKQLVISHFHFGRDCVEYCGRRILITGPNPNNPLLIAAPIANYHGAFGFFGGSTVLLIAMALVVLVVFWLSFRESAARSALVRVAFGLILGGAVGNIVDRVQYGYVIDFIDFHLFPNIWHYTFNVADSCITIGVFLLLFSGVTTRRHA